MLPPCQGDTGPLPGLSPPGRETRGHFLQEVNGGHVQFSRLYSLKLNKPIQANWGVSQIFRYSGKVLPEI